ncbi:hypothetical protein ACS0TY_011248 [Phlomoides rotata]
MDPHGNLLGKHGASVKVVRGHRSWTKVEEDALIQCLTDVVNEGWKAENSFRAEIFGKDRATGEHTIDPIDLVNELYRNVMEYEGETCRKTVPLNNEVMHDTEEDSICKPTDSVIKTVYKGKKRKNSEPDLHMLVDSLGEFMKTSTVAMGDLGKEIEKGNPLSSDTTKLNEIMKGIIGLKVADKLKILEDELTDKLEDYMRIHMQPLLINFMKPLYVTTQCYPSLYYLLKQ